LKTLILAEKPSVASDIAKFLAQKHGLQIRKTEERYYIVGNYCVANFIGHIMENAPPEHYNPVFGERGWSASVAHLPIIPKKWKLIKTHPKQYRLIERLWSECDTVIHAGDPDEEGQLLIDEVLWSIGNNKPTKRLWLSAMDNKSMNNAFSSMKDNSAYLGWSNYALARSRADWIFGINMTRIVSVSAERRLPESKGPISIGRVQTPTLALIVKREHEIVNFRAKDYFIPWIEVSGKPDFKAKWQAAQDDDRVDADRRLLDKNLAESFIANARSEGVAKVVNCSMNPGTENPNLPFALSGIQALASKKYGIGANKTLEIMQSLYEKKLTSYPRTDCEFLPESQFQDAKNLLLALAHIKDPVIQQAISSADTTIKSRAWNDAKVGAHHGIIPISIDSAPSLRDDEYKLYIEVVKRFIIQFYPAAKTKLIAITLSSGGENWFVSEKIYVDKGWKDAFRDDEDDKDDNSKTSEKPFSQSLPQTLKVGDVLKVIDTGINSEVTVPPKRFQEGTLITAMAKIHQHVSDPKVKRILKENTGIGTEATRASIIETLFKRGYIVSKGKELSPTPLSVQLISVLPDEIITPDLTAAWQATMDDIKHGKANCDKFVQAQGEWVTELVKTVPEIFRSMPIRQKEQQGNGRKGKPLSIGGHSESNPCPQCAKANQPNRNGVLVKRVVTKDGPNKGKAFLVCSLGKESCNFIAFPK